MKHPYLKDRHRPLGADEREKLFRAHEIDWNRLVRGRSLRTVQAMGSDIALYVLWCDDQGVAPFPLPIENLARYVGTLIDRGLKLTSVRRYIYSVGALHLAQQHPHPGDHPGWPPLWEALVWRLQEIGAQGDVQAVPLTKHDFGQMVAACGPNRWGLRDRALLHVARDSLCKSSQLSALRLEDIYGQDDFGGGYLRVPPVGAAKAEDRCDYRPLSPASLEHIATWCTVADIEGGYLFLAIGGRRRADTSSLGGGLRPQEVSRIIRRLAVKAGLENAHTLTSESLRVGGVRNLMAAGATLDQIRQSAGWKTYRGIQRQAAWPPNVKPMPWPEVDDDYVIVG